MRRLIAVSATCVVALATFASSAAALAPGHLTGADCVGDAGSQNCAASTNGLENANAVAISPDGRDVYVGAAIDDAIVHMRRDPEHGGLTPVSCIDDNDPGQGPDTCAQSTDGLNSLEDVAVSPDGRAVYAVSDNDSTLVRFARDPSTGALTPLGCVVDNDEATPQPCGQTSIALHGATAIAFSPDGRDVYVAAGPDDAVFHGRRDPVTEALTGGDCADDNDTGAESCATTVDGLADPEDLVVSPDGEQVYVVGNDDDSLVRLPRNVTTGVLTAGTCVDDNDAGQGADTCAASTDALNDPAAVGISPDGKSVYVSAFGDFAVSRFDRAAGGGLTAAGCIHQTSLGETACVQDGTGLSALQDIEVAPDGRTVYIADRGTGGVTSLHRGQDGSIEPLACVQDIGTVCAHQTPVLDLPMRLAVSPDGRDVYVSADAESAIVHLIGERPPVCTGGAGAGLPGALQTLPLDCSDPNDDPLSIATVSSPGGGTLGTVDQGARTVGYTPGPTFSGLDSFTFQAVADGSKSNVATATVLVQAAAGPVGAAGGQGDAGPQGQTGPPGAQGPAGQPGTPAVKLLALLGSDTVTAKRGKRVSFRVAATAPGAATLEILKGRKVQTSIKKTLTKAGRGAIAFSGKVKKKALPAGNYTIRLTVKGKDGQSATDSARLKLTK